MLFHRKTLSIALICILFTTALSDSITAQNTSAVITGPSGEEIEGDPDQPIITGRTANPGETSEPETTGIEHEDIGIAGEEQERKESGEKAGTEDINIGIGELQDTDNQSKSIEIDDDLLIAVTEEKSGGEVIIKGSKIKENSPQFDKDHDKWIELLTIKASTAEELQAYTLAKTYSDRNIEQVTFSPTKITMDYNHPAKLFGLINIDYTYHVEVDELGRIKTKLPWWLFLTENNAGDISAGLESEFAALGDDAQLSSLDLQQTIQRQQQTIQAMSSVMKTAHDTAMASIRKIG